MANNRQVCFQSEKFKYIENKFEDQISLKRFILFAKHCILCCELGLSIGNLDEKLPKHFLNCQNQKSELNSNSTQTQSFHQFIISQIIISKINFLEICSFQRTMWFSINFFNSIKANSKQTILIRLFNYILIFYWFFLHQHFNHPWKFSTLGKARKIIFYYGLILFNSISVFPWAHNFSCLSKRVDVTNDLFSVLLLITVR